MTLKLGDKVRNEAGDRGIVVALLPEGRVDVVWRGPYIGGEPKNGYRAEYLTKEVK